MLSQPVAHRLLRCDRLVQFHLRDPGQLKLRPTLRLGGD